MINMNEEKSQINIDQINTDIRTQLNDDRPLRHNSPMAVLPIILGIALNFACSHLAGKFALPIYLDTIGTVAAAALGGYLPGIVTGLATNIINFYSDGIAIYYAALNALIAVATTAFIREERNRKVRDLVLFILVLAFIGGFNGAIITWLLTGPGDDSFTVNGMAWFESHLHTGPFPSFLYLNYLLDVIDKTITVFVAVAIVSIVPKHIKKKLWFSGWKQTPVTKAEREIQKHIFRNGHSLNTRIAIVLVFASLSMALVVTAVSTSLFRDYSRAQHTKLAEGFSNVVAGMIDPDMVDRYIEEGEAAPGYKEIKEQMYRLRESSTDVEYIYVYKIEEDGCHVVFDLDTDDLPGAQPGELVPFDESFHDLIPKLLAGEAIDPIETNDTYGWLLTVYHPVYNDAGECVCYTAADIEISDIRAYEKNFLLRMPLLFIGFFILILVIGLWLAKYHVILPVNSMAMYANEFAFNDNDEKQARENVQRILDLKIATGDEIQNLYESFCKMTSDSVTHMENIREQNRVISRMQNGLIMVMADMVEGRDSDTGNHIRKTAAYTRILLERLREKGYYSDQITDSFIDDVEQSAPLHDVGKIAVSDVILNKPGKLTDEEFDIMKTHTTEGKRLIEQAISTVEGEGGEEEESQSYLKEARNMAAYHHEKWNGRGYPEGLSGEDIPLSARVMAIADVFDALTSKRVYKDAMPFEKAVSIIQEDAGTHFDPKCVEAFNDTLEAFRKVLNYYTDLENSGDEEDKSSGPKRDVF